MLILATVTRDFFLICCALYSSYFSLRIICKKQRIHDIMRFFLIQNLNLFNSFNFFGQTSNKLHFSQDTLSQVTLSLFLYYIITFFTYNDKTFSSSFAGPSTLLHLCLLVIYQEKLHDMCVSCKVMSSL